MKQDEQYAARLQAQLVEPMRLRWTLDAVPLTDFEWLNAALLVRHRQQCAADRPKPLFVALPAHGEDLSAGLRIATTAAWLAGHEPPAGRAVPYMRPGDHVFHDETIWKVEAAPDQAGKAALRRVSDNRARTVAAADCRKLAALFEFAGLLDDKRAGFRYEHYHSWLEKLLAGTRQAQRLFRMADKDSIPRPHDGLSILVAPPDAFRHFEETVLQKVPGLPLCWTRRTSATSSKQLWGLPFAASITVVASLAEALELRKQARFANIKNWHLSVVGKAAVGNSLKVSQLVQAYEGRQWASLTFWGPDLGVGETPGCVVWPWSRTEARSPQAPPDPVRLVVAPLPALAPAASASDSAAGLPELVAAVRTILLTLSQPTAPGVLPVRLPMVWNLLHRCLRFALPPGAASTDSRRYLSELGHQITDCLGSDEVDDAFFDAQRRWPEREATAQALQTAFTGVLAYFQQHSPKHECLSQLVAEALEEGRPVLIASDRESLAATQASWRGATGVTVLPLLGTPDSLRRRLLDGHLTADTLVAVPFLFNRDQLALLQTSPGPVVLVLLAEVEDGLYERTLASQQQQELGQLRASGRTAMLGQTYEQLGGTAAGHGGATDAATGRPAPSTPGTASRAGADQLDYFAELYAVGDTRYVIERQRSRASGQVFVFGFTDDSRTELDGHTRVLRREAAGADTEAGPAGWVPAQADQLEPGETVLFYENDQEKLIERILRQHDQSGLILRIDKASRTWQHTLEQLADCYKSTTSLYQALRQRGGLDVGQQTLQAYLDGRRRFPGDPTTLPALRILAEHHELASPLLAPGAIEEVHYCRSKFQQLAVGLGKGLSDEVLRYRLTGHAGKLLGSLAPDVREIALLSAVERTVREVRRK